MTQKMSYTESPTIKNLKSAEGGIPGLRMDEVRHIVFATLISVDYEGISEDEKQEIIDRYQEENTESFNWKYVLEPIKDALLREKFIELLEYEPGIKPNTEVRGYAAKAGVV